MSWLYSRELVAGYSEGSCLDGAQFALWSGTSTPQLCSPKDKTMGYWNLSRYGMTYKPLTDDHGEALLTSYLEAFRAKTSALPVKERASTENEAGCGDTWRELSVMFDRVSCSWKTHQCLFIEDLPESSLTFPKWGMIRDGVLWEQTTPERRTVESESGFWPTPDCQNHRDGTKLRKDNNLATGGRHGVSLHHAVMWPTPRAGRPGSRPNGKGGKILQEEVQISAGIRNRGQKWTTPTAHNAKEQDSPAEATRETPTLTHQARGGDKTQPRYLNPEWVEWLMGWPIGWTDLKPLGMVRFQAWLRSHGES